MTVAHLDARQGVTAEMLLGALVDAGASVERIDQVISSLGGGLIKFTWFRVPRDDDQACAVRVRAPERTPDVSTWHKVRDLLRYVAVDDAVRNRAGEVAEHLFTAEAAVAGLGVDELDLPEVGVLDALAVILGIAAATEELGIEAFEVTPIGVGEGRVQTFEGEYDLPVPAVAALLADFPTVVCGTDQQYTTATAAAVLRTMGRPTNELTMNGSRTGVGAGPRMGAHESFVRLTLP